MTFPVCAQPLLTQMRRGRLPASGCRHVRVDGLKRLSGRNASPRGITPSNIMSPARSHPRPWTEVSPGARAHNTTSTKRYRGPPEPAAVSPQPNTALDKGRPDK